LKEVGRRRNGVGEEKREGREKLMPT